MSSIRRIFRISPYLVLLLLILFVPAGEFSGVPRSLIGQFGSSAQRENALPTQRKLVDHGFWGNMIDWLGSVVSSGSNRFERRLSATSNLPIVLAAGILRVQGNARGVWSSGSQISNTLSTTPTDGNLLIATVALRTSNSGPLVIVSSIVEAGVTWSKVVSEATGSYYGDTEIWMGVVGSGASTDVTVNLSGTPSQYPAGIVNICEYSGLQASSVVDQTARSNGHSSTTSTGITSVTTQAVELWVGSIGAMGTASQSSPTNGFNMLDGALVNGNFGNAYLEKIVSSTGTATSGTSASVTYWCGVIATFKATTGPPPSDFTITATTPSQTVGAGATATYTLTITYSPTLTATVDLTVTSGCPTGVTCTLTPNSVTSAGAVTLSVPTLITTPGGTTSITVTATSLSPALSHSVSVQLTVSSPGSYGFNVHAGATQVIVTVSWTGSGIASVTLTGPGGSPTLSESAATVYDRTTYVSGSSSLTNIHRVTFTITAPTSDQTWTALVSLSGSYTTTIEVY